MNLAGYLRKMTEFLKVNPGLQRRIKNQFQFQDFSFKELAEITVNNLIADGKRFPLNTEELFIECFNQIKPCVARVHNEALCTDLIDHIQIVKKTRLPLTCPEK